MLDLADSALAPVPLLAALKHPLAAGGLAPERFASVRAGWKRRDLRGPRPAPGFAGLAAAALEPARTGRGCAALSIAWSLCLTPPRAALIERDRRAARRAASTAHAAAAERLAATDGERGPRGSGATTAGEAAAHSATS